MALEHGKRLLSVVLVAGCFVVGAASHAVAASNATDKEYSESDCEVVQSIEIDSSSGSGYYGATARKASQAFGDAADDIEDDGLKSAMETLSRVFGAAGRARGAIGASRAIAKSSKAYTKALDTWTSALGTCAKQSFGSDDDDTTSTTSEDD